MHSDREFTALKDLSANIDLAFDFAGIGFQQFSDDLKTAYAVIRCLEIISEASRRLSDDLKLRHPHIHWRNIAGSGNIYRHNYEEVELNLVWDTVHKFLPDLKRIVMVELERYR